MKKFSLFFMTAAISLLFGLSASASVDLTYTVTPENDATRNNVETTYAAGLFTTKVKAAAGEEVTLLVFNGIGTGITISSTIIQALDQDTSTGEKVFSYKLKNEPANASTYTIKIGSSSLSEPYTQSVEFKDYVQDKPEVETTDIAYSTNGDVYEIPAVADEKQDNTKISITANMPVYEETEVECGVKLNGVKYPAFTTSGTTTTDQTQMDYVKNGKFIVEFTRLASSKLQKGATHTMQPYYKVGTTDDVFGSEIKFMIKEN